MSTLYTKIEASGLFPKISLYFAKFIVELENKSKSNQAKDTIFKLFLTALFCSKATLDGHICLNLSVINEIFQEEIETLGLNTFSDSDFQSKLLDCNVISKPGEFTPLIINNSKIYLHRYWQYEQNLITTFSALAKNKINFNSEELLEKEISLSFPELLKQEARSQKQAIFKAFTSKLTIITGGPGTGKTSTITKLYSLLSKYFPGKNIAIAAPTGKATVKINSILDNPIAITIHRLMGARKSSSGFQYNNKNKLPYDIIIIDEASMIDLPLMSKVLDALDNAARLILIGDKDQLSSVEPGAFFGQLCTQYYADPAIKNSIIKLTHNYRFQKDSSLNKLVKYIQNNQTLNPTNLNKLINKNDIFIINCPSDKSLEKILTEKVIPQNTEYIKAITIRDALKKLQAFKVLSPVNKGPFGIRNLNFLIEKILEKKGLIQKKGQPFYENQPIIVRKNDYSLKLFNGDVGVIRKNKAGKLSAFFEGPNKSIKEVMPALLPKFDIAYAMTVHKAQGSEFEKVLFVVGNTKFLSRELIYTALTRAKKSVEIVGDIKFYLKIL
ncbi:exodeoxyribonuclease V subunit alpha [Candidatus Margulisiibacteriota bacterium]